MRVLKFGGTSVGTADSMDSVLDITLRQIDQAPVLVSSAMSGVTNLLEEIADESIKGNTSGAFALLSRIENKHGETAESFLTQKRFEESATLLGAYFVELRSLITGLSLLRECSPRSRDKLLAFGEKLSTTLLYLRARERGIDVEWLDAETFMITDDHHTAANPLYPEMAKAIQEKIQPVAGKILITQGFVGSTLHGETSTLGRGGSDFTASLIGSALKAEEVQIWTDVDGILSTDPRIVPEARRVEQITYEVAAELAYFGAKVVHPSTMQPAVDHAIPVRVKNTHNPDNPGTLISAKTESAGLRAISLKKNITIIQITSSRMLNAYGFLSRIFEIFNKHAVPVDLIATSEVSVSLTVEKIEILEELTEDLSALGSIEILKENNIVCLVGRGLWKDSSFIAKTFSAIEGIPIQLISLGASDTNLSIVVPAGQGVSTVKRLHAALFNH